MKVIKLDEVEEKLQKFIDARKNRNCSKQAIVERTAFEYALAIVKKCETYDIEDL